MFLVTNNKVSYPCSNCSEIKYVNTSKVNLEKYKKQYPYCHSCSAKKAKITIQKGWFKKGSLPWNKGILGDYLPHWKGDKVSYDALHDWVQRKLGKPMSCEFCGGCKNLQWSNKSNQYKRDLTDWQRLCMKCHSKYDFDMVGARKEFYK